MISRKFPVLTKSEDGSGCRQDFLRKQECDRIQQLRYRTSDLSAADPSVQDVHPRSIDGKSPDEFDEETLTTINKFFENSLNVSETSRQLYIHRNTLVYRLDKLQKSTGLDLRVFEDAITFKIALMVAST